MIIERGVLVISHGSIWMIDYAPGGNPHYSPLQWCFMLKIGCTKLHHNRQEDFAVLRRYVTLVAAGATRQPTPFLAAMGFVQLGRLGFAMCPRKSSVGNNRDCNEED
jgi:hypothetical protein